MRVYPSKAVTYCETCGVGFYKKPGKVAQSAHHYCSTACCGAANRQGLAARLWRKVDKDRPVVRPELGPCWVWTGRTDSDGYGRLPRGGHASRDILAHRAAWIVIHGEPPDRTPCVLHRCDNPPCVNPAHLFLGTKGDNSADMVLKARSARGDRNASRTHPERVPWGEGKVRSSKLTAEQVREIRMRRAAGETQRAIALTYGITQSNVSHILRGDRWRRLA